MFGKEKKEKRFLIKDEQSSLITSLCVVVDTNTGVNYLMTIGQNNTSIIPLLDSDGKVLVDK